MKQSFLLFTLLAVGIGMPTAQAQSFGGSVAASENVIFAAETSNRVTNGVVYAYTKAGGTWSEAQQLEAPGNDGSEDGFGRSIAVYGNGVMVGAPVQGVVHRFRPNRGGRLTASGTISAPDAVGDANFGATLSVEGDLLAVGSPNAHDGKGAVSIFKRIGDDWAHQATMVGEADGHRLGSTVLVSGTMVMAGATAGDDHPGNVLVYASSDAGWSQVDDLNPTGETDRIGFGSALHVANGTLFVGAPRANRLVGAVYTYTHDANANTWQAGAILTPFDGERSAFGSNFTTMDGEMWVGAPWGNGFTGAVYRFGLSATGAIESASKLTRDDAARRSGFGGSISVAGSTAVFGVPGDDYGAGAIYVYSKSGDSWSEEARLINDVRGYEAVSGRKVSCEEGMAGDFPCEGVDMLSFMPVSELGGARGVRVNDIWGWTDPVSRREYALIGRSDGTSFVDVTDAGRPVYLGNLPMTETANGSVWRDIKVYRDHAFIVSDGAGQHGMQVFDLTRLRDIEDPVVFEADALYENIASAHNVVINEDTGFAYSVGSSSGGTTCGGGLHMINIQDPKNPQFAGCFADINTGRRGTGYSHDAQCVIYNGPDTEHRGKEICLGSNETALSIADVTDKANPIAIAMAPYPKVAYAHQGWLTEDHRYFYMNDEGDEPQGLVEGTRTIVWDVQDLDEPVVVNEYIAEVQSTDHNLYVRGNLMYQSNYDSGLRILDVSDPENPVEVAFFDTVPYGDNSPATGGGSWSNYPYFESGNIIVTSGREGLFVVRKAQPGT